MMNQAPENESPIANALFDKSSPFSVVNLVPKNVAKKFEQALAEKPDFFGVSEDELERKCGRKIKPFENMLRVRFWYEYDVARNICATEIPLERLCAGICTTHVYFNFLRVNTSVAWLLCMPVSYEVSLEELLCSGTKEMRKLMQLETYDPITRKEDMKLWNLKLNLYLAVEARRFGAVPQLTKNVNYNLSNEETMREISKRGPNSLKSTVEKMKQEEIESIKITEEQTNTIDVADSDLNLVKPEKKAYKNI